LPWWPRLLWGELYEATVTMPLLLSMFSLFIPKKLGFSVTPKGIVTNKRAFDWRVGWMTVLMTLISVAAIIKGIVEFFYFGIEKDAYFFNIGWALFVLIPMFGALLVIWEKPQRRKYDRVKTPFPFRLEAPSFRTQGMCDDISLRGMSLVFPSQSDIPLNVTIQFQKEKPIAVRGRVIYNDEIGPHQYRCGIAFEPLSVDAYQELVRQLFGSAETWRLSHEHRVRNSITMAYYLFKGFFNYFTPTQYRARRNIRKKMGKHIRIGLDGRSKRVWLTNRSRHGLHVFYWGRPLLEDELVVYDTNDKRYLLRSVYSKQILPWLSSGGLVVQDAAPLERRDGIGITDAA